MSKDKRTSVSTYEFPNAEVQKSVWQFIYDPKAHTFLSRTPQSWGKLLVFYATFLSLVAALMSTCMYALFYSLQWNAPTYQLDNNSLGNNPGLAYRPIPKDPGHDVTIEYSLTEPEEIERWTEKLLDFLEPYYNSSAQSPKPQNEVNCDYRKPMKPNQVCSIDPKGFGPCNPANGFGYNGSEPCLFLKLNRIHSWVPKYYDKVNDLPSEMPIDLQQHIASTPLEHRQQVWVSCSAPHGVGSFQYYPNRGFPSYFYPFKHQDGYLSPVVAVQLKDVLIDEAFTIECRTWARNIAYSKSMRGRQGSMSVTFVIRS